MHPSLANRLSRRRSSLHTKAEDAKFEFEAGLICSLSLSLFRKESSFNLGSAETKLLLTMHWIMVDAPDECVLETADKNPGGVESGPFAYLFPLSAITVSEPQCGRRATLPNVRVEESHVSRRGRIANRPVQ